MQNHLGQIYQQKTKYSRHSMEGRKLDWDNKPDSYKEYNGNYQLLPGPRADVGKSLWQSLLERKSVRQYTGEHLSPEELGQLLWAVTGATRVTARKDFYFRTAPSAGGLFPIETYLQINRVRDFQPGVYHYSVPRHGLYLIQEGDFRDRLTQAALGQQMVKKLPLISFGLQLPAALSGSMVNGASAIFTWTPATLGKTFTWQPQRWILVVAPLVPSMMMK